MTLCSIRLGGNLTSTVPPPDRVKAAGGFHRHPVVGVVRAICRRRRGSAAFVNISSPDGYHC